MAEETTMTRDQMIAWLVLEGWEFLVCRGGMKREPLGYLIRDGMYIHPRMREPVETTYKLEALRALGTPDMAYFHNDYLKKLYKIADAYARKLS